MSLFLAIAIDFQVLQAFPTHCKLCPPFSRTIYKIIDMEYCGTRKIDEHESNGRRKFSMGMHMVSLHSNFTNLWWYLREEYLCSTKAIYTVCAIRLPRAKLQRSTPFWALVTTIIKYNNYVYIWCGVYTDERTKLGVFVIWFWCKVICMGKEMTY